MEPTPELIRQLRREEIEDARRLTPAQRFLAGPELFDLAAEFAFAGIRMQNPSFSEQQVRAEFRRRLQIAERVGNSK
jgi:hypothetical protein